MTYVQCGRTSCGITAEFVYKGYVSGRKWDTNGGGTDTLCLSSDPTWGNHNTVFAKCGLDVRKYRYFNKKTKGLDFEGMIADLRAAAPGSCVMLHTCAHNPTGVDPTLDQWKQIAVVCKERALYPFFDTAY